MTIGICRSIRCFVRRRKDPKARSLEKNYHFLYSVRVRSRKQEAIENTVIKQKLRRAGFMVIYAVICLIIYYVLFKVFPDPGETAEFIIDLFKVAAQLLWVNAVLMAVGTIQGPVTIKDVQKYDDKIQEALRDLENTTASGLD